MIVHIPFLPREFDTIYRSMAALNFCSNWDMLNQQLLFQETELHGFHDDFTLADTSIDPLFEPSAAANDFIISSADKHPHFLPHFWPHDPSISLTPHEFDTNVPKRRKHNDHIDQFYVADISMPCCFLDGYVPNYSTTSPVVPNFSPGAYGCGTAENWKKTNGGSLSAQSVAARRRRKKITEKTEELGKLVPGGRKMHTAEMFQSAFKYVKYLQAQVGVLELTRSIQKNEDPLMHQEDLQALLASPIIQEKLYSEEKCLVPQRLVQNIANDREIQSTPLILSEINQFFGIEG